MRSTLTRTKAAFLFSINAVTWLSPYFTVPMLMDVFSYQNDACTSVRFFASVLSFLPFADSGGLLLKSLLLLPKTVN